MRAQGAGGTAAAEGGRRKAGGAAPGPLLPLRATANPSLHLNVRGGAPHAQRGVQVGSIRHCWARHTRLLGFLAQNWAGSVDQTLSSRRRTHTAAQRANARGLLRRPRCAPVAASSVGAIGPIAASSAICGVSSTQCSTRSAAWAWEAGSAEPHPLPIPPRIGAAAAGSSQRGRHAAQSSKGRVVGQAARRRRHCCRHCRGRRQSIAAVCWPCWPPLTWRCRHHKQ